MESTIRPSVPSGTKLIETFRWEPDTGFLNLDRHLARMERSAEALGFDYEDLWALYVIQARGDIPLRCRLTLGEEGFDFTSAPLGGNASEWRIAVSDVRLSSNDLWLKHKTTQRQLYDEARATLPDGVDELIFLNERDEVCEGTITNVFAQLDDGSHVTPPLSAGVLPGIQREISLEQGYSERVLTLDMLRNAREIHVGNSLRGLIPVKFA